MASYPLSATRVLGRRLGLPGLPFASRMPAWAGLAAVHHHWQQW
ncbi:hypothetical protein [Gloeocapsopsis dulcis]|nr:hypothetical protein [Gloeocapsopsis dulcis]WNN92263.1 hypothetical protein P0S91_25705 [Gloeocapsopsis dulcis]